MGDDQKEAAINEITAAERNIKDYDYYPTHNHRENRHHKYRDDGARSKLRTEIINELFSHKRLGNDNDISLGSGGAMPTSNQVGIGKAFYVIGPPASGKSGIASNIADAYNCYLLDSDFAKRKLPEYTTQIGAASLVHEESDEIVFGADGLMEKCLEKHYNMVIPKIGHTISSTITFCSALKKAGYKVYLISIDLDRQKAVQRAYNRYVETHRYVPLSLIFDGYGNQPTLNYFKIKQQYHDTFDGFAQINTDIPLDTPVLVVESENIEMFDSIDWR